MLNGRGHRSSTGTEQEAERAENVELVSAREHNASRTSPLPQGVPGRALLRFAGSVSEETLKRMEQVIEEEFEQVDYENW